MVLVRHALRTGTHIKMEGMLRDMAKHAAALLLAVILPVCFSATAGAGFFSYSLSTEKAAPGDIIKLYANAKKSEAAAGFRMKITYDEDVLKYIGTEASALIKSGTMKTNDSSSPLYSVYVCNAGKSRAPKLSGNIICYVFQVKSGAPPGKTAVEAEADQICDYDGKKLSAGAGGKLYVDITEQSSGEAYLVSLEPLSGRLKPDFSSAVHDYAMQVPYSVSSVEFKALAGSGGSVSINRRTLYAAGKSTLITVTVKSADGKSKACYTVTVKRDAKQPRAAETGTSSPIRSSVLPPPAGSGENVSAGKAGITASKSQSRPAVKERRSSSGAVAAADNVKSAQPAEKSAASAAAPAPAGGRAEKTRVVYITENGMPAFMGGMLAAAACLACGVALALWLRPPDKKR